MKLSTFCSQTIPPGKMFLTTALALMGLGAIAQSVSLTTMGVAYTQDFNGLSNTAGSTTNSLTLPGWYMSESGALANGLYAVGTGASAVEDTYSYGSAGSTDRALGSLYSASLIPLYGISFTNNTGTTITRLVIQYTGEQWRLGLNGTRKDSLTVDYSLNATSLSTGSWMHIIPLTFSTPNLTPPVGAKDGNATGYRTVRTATLTGLSIANGNTFWLRWNDIGASINDDGLAIDDFSLMPTLSGPEIDVTGNTVSIASGDITPSTADNTDFSNQSVCSGVTRRTFNILNTGTAVLNLSGTPIVSVSGTHAGDFTVVQPGSSSLAPGASSTFTVNFDPSAAGIRSATLSIANNDADENPYVFAIQGNGIVAGISSATQTNVSCFGGLGGAISITASGTGTLSYDWAPGTPTGDGTPSVSGLAAGIYTVTVTDAGLCSATASYTITQPNVISVSVASQTNVSCFGGSNGGATISATGGTGSFTYSWAPSGGTSATATGLTMGIYTVTVRDANNCLRTQTVSITQPTAISAAISSTATSCSANTGIASVSSASGGTGAYTYSWSPSGGTAATATGLVAGVYTVAVRDANLCTYITTTTISIANTLSLTVASQTNVSCFGGNNGAASVNPATGGTGTLTYSWIPSGGSSTTASGLSAGGYTVTVKDADNCTKSQTLTITAPAALTASVSASPVLCHGGISTTTVSAIGGTPAYAGTGTFTTTAGVRTFTVTDNKGCISTTSISISEPSALTVTVTASPVLCNGGASSITVSASGGTAPYIGTGTGTFTAVSGTRSYSVTDNNGCVNSMSISISEPTALIPSVSSSPILCHGGISTVTVSATGGSPGYTGIGSFTATAGVRTYTVTDNNGCAKSASITITQPAAITRTQTKTLCNGQSLVVGTHTYSATGTYTDVLQAANGCDSTIITSLTVNAPVNVSTTLNGNTISANATSATYQWINCNGNTAITGAISQSFTPSSSGSYAVIVTVGTCSNTSSCVSVTLTTTGIDNLSKETTRIYPNPTVDYVIVETESDQNHLQLVDILGKVVLNETLKQGRNEITLKGLKEGVYIVTISDSSGTKTQRLLISK